MSRRKDRAGINYGQLILQCPHGHPLGAVVLHGSTYSRLDGPLRDNVEVPSYRLPIGEKVKARCPACHEEGRRPDYQASWKTVVQLLQVERDTPSEQRTLKLG
jgi:hypothetical protein